jgi:hypothetical protein
VFLRFRRTGATFDGPEHSRYYAFSSEYEEVERPQESYDFDRLPGTVASDFREALIFYSQGCFNAFAAISRRTIQSASSMLGAKGEDKVLKQIEDLRELAQVDEETFSVIKQLVISGHDAAHPHLPALQPERAEILLEPMKDVLYQLFVRQHKLEEAAAKRKLWTPP